MKRITEVMAKVRDKRKVVASNWLQKQTTQSAV
jgi:hypothetical protein